MVCNSLWRKEKTADTVIETDQNSTVHNGVKLALEEKDQNFHGTQWCATRFGGRKKTADTVIETDQNSTVHNGVKLALEEKDQTSTVHNGVQLALEEG